MTEVEDYEDIDLDPALISRTPGQAVSSFSPTGVPGVTSPLRRPPMPLPGSATCPESKCEYSFR